MACITMLNKIGLSTDPWCTPTLTSKLSLSSPFLLTAVVTPSYILLMTFTIHSSTPTCLKAHPKPHVALCRRPSPSPQTPSTAPSVCQGTFPEPVLHHHHHHLRFTSIMSIVHTKARVRRYQLMLDLIVAPLIVALMKAECPFDSIVFCSLIQ